MPGLKNKTLTGYFETDYENPWPGLVTNLPTSQIPPGACSSCNAMVVRGRLTPQPAIFTVTGTGGMSVSMPTFAAGENVCVMGNLELPGAQQGFTVIITNVAVYSSWVLFGTITTVKTFNKIFTFPNAYPRYARFGTQVIGNTLYFSSGSALGVYALRPTFGVLRVQITNPGGYFTTPPSVIFSDGAGTGAAANATLSGVNLGAVTVVASGSGYVTPPVVNFQGGSTTGPLQGELSASAVGILQANPTGYVVQEITALTGVAWFNVTADGSGYVNPTVAIIGGGGTGATGSAILTQTGTIGGIIMDSPGQNYTSTPTVQIIDSVGTGAAATAEMFEGTPFIGGDFMASMSQKLILGNIIGGDGNNTTTVGQIQPVSLGSGYSVDDSSTIDFVGGGGEGASAYGIVSGTGQIVPSMGSSIAVTGNTTSGSNVITGISSILNIKQGAKIAGVGITVGATITSITSTSATFTASTNLNSPTINVSSIAGIFAGDTIIAPGIPAGTIVISVGVSSLLLSGNATATQSGVTCITSDNSFTISSNATATGNFDSLAVFQFKFGDSGSGYSGTPAVNILSNSGTGAVAIAQLFALPQAASSTTRYPDRVAWSAPSAYGYFDPNYGIAPGGFDTLSEARGLISSLNVVESVAFIGHNGGITEMTPNTQSAITAFSFYPLWGGDQGQIVRYGSMAQFGTTLAFLAQDTAYTMTPNGLAEIGQNIANTLQEAGIWNNGDFELQGLYGSIVLIEGQKHYLLAFSSDAWNTAQNGSVRSTKVYDYNMNENSWHSWSWSGQTITCPIYQSFDVCQFFPVSGAGVQISRDSWLLMAWTSSTGSSVPFGEQAVVYEIAPLTREIQLLSLPEAAFVDEVISYQFRTESPSIARMQQERRILVEYENQPSLVPLDIPTEIGFNYTGQQDPTDQTGTVVQTAINIFRTLTNLNGPEFPGQVLTTQTDFGTFTGVCTSLRIVPGASRPLIALVRVTQVADLPKGMVP